MINPSLSTIYKLAMYSRCKKVYEKKYIAAPIVDSDYVLLDPFGCAMPFDMPSLPSSPKDI